jgi:hypothetical protein
MRHKITWALMSMAAVLFVFAASSTRGQDFKGGFGGPGAKGKGGFDGGPGGFPGKGGFGPSGLGKGKGGFGGKGKGAFGGGPGGFPGQDPFQRSGPGDGFIRPFDGPQSNEDFNQMAASMQNGGGSPSIRIIEEEDLDARPVVLRAGKLPKGLPNWFKQLDANKDGQVALYEWYKGGKDVDEFREWDRNDDGFITAEEALYKQRLVQIASAGSQLESDNSAAAAAMRAGKGPDMSSPVGAFRGKGKGDKGKQRPQ